MPRTGRYVRTRYTRCPDCGRKTVIWSAGRNGTDGYYCKWRCWKQGGCSFGFYQYSGAAIDKRNEKRWLAANGSGDPQVRQDFIVTAVEADQ